MRSEEYTASNGAASSGAAPASSAAFNGAAFQVGSHAATAEAWARPNPSNWESVQPWIHLWSFQWV